MILNSEINSCTAPVVVHITNEHGVERVEIPAEHRKLIQNEQLCLLVVAFTVGLQQLLFSHNLHLQHINNLSLAIDSLD